MYPYTGLQTIGQCGDLNRPVSINNQRWDMATAFHFTHTVMVLSKSTCHLASPGLQSPALLILRSHVPSQRTPNCVDCSYLNCFLLHFVLVVQMFVAQRLGQVEVSVHAPYHNLGLAFHPSSCVLRQSRPQYLDPAGRSMNTFAVRRDCPNGVA